MEYMLLINSDQSNRPAPGTPGFDQMMEAFLAYNQHLIDGGHYVSGASLAPTSSATTVRVRPGERGVLTDGPYAETKEQLGGYYVVSAADLDEAIALAEAIPVPGAIVEVRPVAFRPDAG